MTAEVPEPDHAAVGDKTVSAFIRDRAEQYDPECGTVVALEDLAVAIARGEHWQARKHGELDDLLNEDTRPCDVPDQADDVWQEECAKSHLDAMEQRARAERAEERASLNFRELERWAKKCERAEECAREAEAELNDERCVTSDEVRQLEAQLANLRGCIEGALDYANGRWSEWGERAEECCGILETGLRRAARAAAGKGGTDGE